MLEENKIIIMDDDIEYANLIFDIAKSFKLNCIITTNAKDFMDLFNQKVSLVFLDLNIPHLNGIDLLKFISKKNSKCDIVLMSGAEDRVIESAENFAKSINLNVAGRFQKTIRLTELENLLKNIIANNFPKTSERSLPVTSSFFDKDELAHALKNNEFLPYYQPQIDLETSKLYGVEVQTRWLNSQQRTLLADQFALQMESFGLIDELMWFIFKKSIKEIEDLQKQTQFPLKFSLNLPSRILKDLDFPQKFMALFEQSTLTPNQVTFEITESGIMKDLSNALEIFTRLGLNHINLSLDNFGAGSTTMQQLKLIPANQIKIDKYFIKNMLIEKSVHVTVKKIIELGHELEMKVVAKGVDSQEQLQFLQEHHCDAAQGAYFSKAMPIQDLHQWINSIK